MTLFKYIFGTISPERQRPKGVIPTEATQHFLAHVFCALGRVVEGPWQYRSPTKIGGTHLANAQRRSSAPRQRQRKSQTESYA